MGSGIAANIKIQAMAGDANGIEIIAYKSSYISQKSMQNWQNDLVCYFTSGTSIARDHLIW